MYTVEQFLVQVIMAGADVSLQHIICSLTSLSLTLKLVLSDITSSWSTCRALQVRWETAGGALRPRERSCNESFWVCGQTCVAIWSCCKESWLAVGRTSVGVCRLCDVFVHGIYGEYGENTAGKDIELSTGSTEIMLCILGALDLGIHPE